MISAIALLALGSIGPKDDADRWRMGVLWFFLIIGLELLAGHIDFGASWITLLANCILLRGRVWLLVLCGQLLSPWLAARLRREFPSTHPPVHDDLRLTVQHR